MRDRNGNQGVEWIDQVIGKYKNTDFAKIWVCTFGNCNLSKDAIRALKYNNIGWRNIEICNNEKLEKDIPILSIDALKIIDDDTKMLINDEEYKDLMIYGKNEQNEVVEISLRMQIINEIKKILSSDIDNFIDKSNIEYEMDIELENIENNFNTNKLHIKINLPIIHHKLFDFFSESYVVRNNEIPSKLLTTKNNSIFITDDCIVLNFSFLENLRLEGYLISNHYILNIKAIPEEYRKTNEIKIIDVEGNSKDVLTKVIGYK